eukprot:jgi/Psemu1/45303/gm1.45303_g
MAPTSPTATSTTTLVFAKLDPILQGLLAELTALKGIIPSVVSTDRHEATLVRRFRNIAGSLEALSRGVQSLIWEKGETSNSVGREPTEDILLLRRQRNEQCTKSLCLLADYVTLPLTAIFHLSLREIFVADVEETHKGDEWQRTLRIRRSYVFQMHRLAASAIRTYVEATSLPSGGPRLDETSREDGVGCGRNPSNLLPSDTRIKYLVALIQSMPSFLELNETTSTTTTTTTTTTTIITTQGSSLDDGSDSWVAILETAQSLLATFRSDRDHPDTDARGSSHRDTEISHGRLLEAWYGTLSMRLVDCLTAFLANHPAKNNAPFFSPLVRRAALATLGLLLKITMEVCGHGPSDGAKNGASQPSLSPSSFWRSVFPGVFAALYQQTMDGTLVYGNQRRSEASSSSSSLRIELQAMSLDSLIVLFRATLLSSNRSISNPARPGTNLLDEDSNSSPDGYSDTNDLLARLTSMVATVTIHDSNGNNKNRGDGSGSDRNEKPSNKESDEDEQEFFRRVKHRVEGPLLAVLRKLSVSTSDDIRRKVVLLCKVLLLETEDRELWRNTSDDGLRSSAAVAMPSATVVGRVCFELCIGFQHDPDATVRTSSREIIERYIQCCKRQPGGDDSLPSSSPSDWMVPRTIELIQTLSALVHKGVDAASSRVHGATPAMELRAELNLVAGYLQFLVEYKNRETASKKHTGGTKESNGIAMTTTMDSACIYSELFDVDFDSWKDNKTNLVSVVIGRSEEDISSITIRGGSTLSVDRIQNAGLLTLKMMAYSCGLQNIEDLINTEHNQLVAAMVGRLRLLGGSKTPKYFSEAEEISHITKNATWIIGMMTKRIEQRYSESGERVPSPFFDSKQKTKSSIVDLVSLLDYRLDHLFLQKIPDDADVESICSLHKVLYDFFLQLFDVKKDHIYSYQMKNVDHGSKPPWLNLLSQFRKSDLELQDIDNDTKSKANEGSYLDINKTDITLFAKLVARDCYLLSSQSMKSRVSTCNAMTSAFKFLAFVGSEHDDPTDDTNLIRNTVLRQVAESWPSIRARLKTLSAEVSASSSIDNSSVVLMLSQSRTKTQGGTFKFEDLGVKKIFLAKLFELIATLNAN